MPRVRNQQPPNTKLSEDGQRYLYPNGNYMPVYSDEPTAAGYRKDDTESVPAPVNPYKKGSPMPKQTEHGENYGRELRLWRDAQRGSPSPSPSPSSSSSTRPSPVPTATSQASALRKKKEEK